MIDLHSHVLPGLDDGARTLAESLEMLRMSARAGIDTVVATPHIRSDFEFHWTEIPGLVEELNAACALEGIDVAVVAGAEIAFESVPDLSDAELAALSFAGGGRYLLMETPYGQAPPGGLTPYVRALTGRGFRVVLAHPERNLRLSEPQEIDRLVDAGALVQLTASSLLGEFGEGVRRRAVELLSDGRAHLLGSDTHHPDARPAALSEASEEILPELLPDEEVEAIVDELAKKCDYIIFDTPPILLAADPFPLAHRADTVILTVREGVTTRGEAEEAAATLAGLGVRRAVVVLNGSIERSAYGYYGSEPSPPGPQPQPRPLRRPSPRPEEEALP